MIYHFKQFLLSLSRGAKRIIMLSSDGMAIPVALWLALTIRTGNVVPYIDYLKVILPILLLGTLFTFIRLRLYYSVLRFFGPEVVWAILKGVTISSLLLAAIITFYRLDAFPRSVLLIYWMLMVLYMGGIRYLVRSFLVSNQEANSGKRTAIYGAGSAGHKLSQMLKHNGEVEPVCFIDDNDSLTGSMINGLSVYHTSKINDLIESTGLDQILLAIPSVSRKRRKVIINGLEKYPIHVYTIPSVDDIVSGKANVDDIREIDIEDLLGRDPVLPDAKLSQACVTSKVVMVTGAGGSIGSELCRQITQLQPQALILFESSEYALYKIEKELELANLVLGNKRNFPVKALLGNVQDRDKLSAVVARFGVQTIYHTAAYKHVPLVEYNIIEGVFNNIFGTLAVAQAAIEENVETLVFVSTDKAVRPTNVMGATKRFAELILQALSETETSTRFCMVRFGNVLGSSSSVVPAFRKQIERGGPVTVTHPDIVRYFMAMTEAAQLVIQAGSMGRGGDVFMLDMGVSIKIDDLARKMIRLMGLTVKDENQPDGDIPIEYTGLRPGEKLFEELLIGENVEGTSHPMIMRAMEVMLPWNEMEKHIDDLYKACKTSNHEMIRGILLAVVNDYAPNGGIVDHLRNSPSIIPLSEDPEALH